MLSDPGKRKRFLVPLGIVLMLISLMFIIPGFLVYLSDKDVSTLAGMSGSLTVFLIGLLLVMYGYNFSDKISSFQKYIVNSIVRSSTRLIFLCLGLAIIAVSAIWVYYEVGDMYMPSNISTWAYWISAMIWPVIIGIVVYIVGNTIECYQSTKTLRMSQMFGFLGLASVGLVALGILDLLQTYLSASYESSMGVLEIIVGVVLSISSNFAKGRLKEERKVTADEVL